MSQPAINLIAFFFIAVLIAVLVWPGKGLFARLVRRGRMSGRVVMEDALKHIYNGEFRGRAATIESMSGVLQIARSRVVELAERLQSGGLVRYSDEEFALTDEGRRYALQIIRAHRLWERYLADETGVDPLKWHAAAEQREHRITPAEADELAARLGNPSHDPHGDPIPTADGVVPDAPVVALSELAVGESARVVHIEDEPEVVFAQLVALGIYLGMDLRVEAKTKERIILEADGRELVLASLLAANVSINRLRPAESLEADSLRTLSDLRAGEACRVVRINPACRGPERRRLMDFGIVPGTLVRYERPAPSGGSAAYLVRGTVIALRKEQTDMITIDIEQKVGT